jgi:hypothetical protein
LIWKPFCFWQYTISVQFDKWREIAELKNGVLQHKNPGVLFCWFSTKSVDIKKNQIRLESGLDFVLKM